MLGHILASVQPWWHVLHLLAILLGLALVVSSLIRFASAGRSRQGGMGASVMMLISGILLVNFAGFMDSISYSMFARASTHSLIAYTGSIGHVSGPMVRLALNIVQLVGLYGVIKGVLLLSRAGSDAKALGPAFTHIIGGTIAVNIVVFLGVLGSTVGGGMQTTITKLF